MKTKLFLLVAMMLPTLFAAAQEENSLDSTVTSSPDTSLMDTTKVSFGETKVLIISPQSEDPDSGQIDASWTIGDDDDDDGDSHRHWAGLDIGVNGLLSSNNSLKLPEAGSFMELNYGRSLYASLNFLEKDFEIVEDRFRIVTGLGLTWNSYGLKRNVTLVPNGDVLSAVNDSVNFDKNKLRVTSLTLPLMIGVNTNDLRRKSFRLAAGVIGRYNFNMKTKQRYEIDNVDYRPTVKDDFHVRPFSAEATVRAGYGPINLYASYGLLSLFEDSAAPELVPFTIGATVLMF